MPNKRLIWTIIVICIVAILVVLIFGDPQIRKAEASGPIPNAPAFLTVTNVTADSVSLEWVDESTNEDNFEIWYQVDGGAWPPPVVFAENTESGTVAGLQCNTLYHFVVRAVNEEGGDVYWSESNWTNKLTLPCPQVETQYLYIPTVLNGIEGPQPNTPADFSFVSSTSDTITVGWVDTSQIEDQFEIKFRPAGSSSPWQTAYESAGYTGYTLSYLSCGVEFEMFMYAVNVEGGVRSESAPTPTILAATQACGQ